jgi:UDP-N-acetyl-alpha-D-muramoyl-L-alanyl-L-glutamate epimerase
MLNESNQHKFLELRKKFPFFVYEGYSFDYSDKGLDVVFRFNLAGKYQFSPSLAFPPSSILVHQVHPDELKNILFHIGMIEMVSYWKAACSPRVIIRNHELSADQVNWWKKLFFNGLGEFFYLNGIHTSRDEFMDITPEGGKILPVSGFSLSEGSLVPVGGGKDSVVTLELLGDMKGNTPFILNPRGATMETVTTKGFAGDNISVARRTLDPLLHELNAMGFLNGHTPFSALLAFTTVLAAMLAGKKHIVLSNESSANEATIPGTAINHQYSKSVEFESDFRDYLSKYITPDINYFSFLRPLNELQIARLFSRYPRYHKVFKSCNAGSKTDSWCGRCSKCLFTCILLSPFLGYRQIEAIFGHNLLEDDTLSPILDELTGVAATKPFDCIGTLDEVNAALQMTLKHYPEGQEPLLLKHYRQSDAFRRYAGISPGSVLREYNTRHFLPGEFERILISALNA